MSKVITQYECKICNKSYASYQSLWIHNKKFHTTVILKTSRTSEKTSETSENILKKNYNCRKCNKVFHNIKTRWSHEKICKQLVSNISNIGNINNTTTNNNTINNNTNSNNNINNITNNKIIINAIGNENILNLSKKAVMNLFNQEFISITGVIELIYFNENHPENHYFCTTNLDSYYSSVYNTEKKTVDKDRKKYLFDKILDNSIEKLELLYSHYKQTFTFNKQKIIEDNIKNINDIKIAFFNNKLKKELFRQINLLSYNNKELIKKTWNGKQKFKKLTFEEDLDLPPSDSENEELFDDSSDELSDNMIQHNNCQNHIN
jgi:hypothetical protein